MVRRDRPDKARPTFDQRPCLVDAAFVGFQLDAPLDVSRAARKRSVADLAEAVAALAAG
jgi:hypothetical protein